VGMVGVGAAVGEGVAEEFVVATAEEVFVVEEAEEELGDAEEGVVAGVVARLDGARNEKLPANAVELSSTDVAVAAEQIVRCRVALAILHSHLVEI